jgi:hypothetical protein
LVADRPRIPASSSDRGGRVGRGHPEQFIGPIDQIDCEVDGGGESGSAAQSHSRCRPKKSVPTIGSHERLSIMARSASAPPRGRRYDCSQNPKSSSAARAALPGGVQIRAARVRSRPVRGRCFGGSICIQRRTRSCSANGRRGSNGSASAVPRDSAVCAAAIGARSATDEGPCLPKRDRGCS